MFFVIIPIVCLIICVILEYRNWGSWGGWMGALGTGTLWAILLSMIICGAAALISDFGIPRNGPVEVTDTIELVAMKDNLGVEGYHNLFSGHVDDELKYFYVYEDEKGRTTGSVRADNSYIKYIDADETPYMEKCQRGNKSEFINVVFLSYETYYVFYLPEGSVIADYYQVDLE